MNNTSINISNNEILLGALLHDIGKLMQRAEVPLSQQSRNMENMICPTFEGRHSHLHVIWTNEFFESFLKNIPDGIDKNATANLACYHHNADNELQLIVTKADRYSSGERIEKDYQEEAAGKYPFKKIRMHSIFSGITLSQDSDNKKTKDKRPQHRIDLQPLYTVESSLFPKLLKELQPSEGESLVEKYKELWKGFCDELPNLPTRSFNHYIQSLQRLLEKYTWCIPSSTIDQPDISLYDHCRTTAAIAVCLYEYHKTTGTITRKAINDDSLEKFILMGGDLSGIQQYIFDIAFSGAKGAGKMLRARSFYVDLVARASVFTILKALNLPLICNIMDSGGRFFLLVPNTDNTEKTLESVSCDIAHWFKEQFMGELSLNLSWDIKLKGKDFSISAFNEVISRITREIEKQKQSKLIGTFIKNGKWDTELFKIDKFYDKYKEEACSACGKRPIMDPPEEIDGELVKICNPCRNIRKIGEKILKINYLFYSYEEVPGQEKLSEFFTGTNRLIHVYSGNNLPQNVEPFFHIEHVNEPEKSGKFFLPVRYMAHHVPVFNSDDERELCQKCELNPDTCKVDRGRGKLKTYTCIAAEDRIKSADNSRYVGRQMVAILKADVDNLGLLFRKGFEREDKGKIKNVMSISRYASFSRMLNLFFTGYMQKLCEESKNQSVYTVYSGGDDLFLVGPWETMIYFTENLNRQFRRYTCENQDITLSAAVLPIRPRYPVRMAAFNVEESLEHAKNEGKNRLRLFNTTVAWKDFQKFREFGKWLVERIRAKDSKIRSAFVYRLLKYHKMAVSGLSGEDIEGLKFHSHMSYDIKRNIEHEEDIQQLFKLYDLTQIDKSLMMGLKIPIFWALYKQRGG